MQPNENNENEPIDISNDVQEPQNDKVVNSEAKTIAPNTETQPDTAEMYQNSFNNLENAKAGNSSKFKILLIIIALLTLASLVYGGIVLFRPSESTKETKTKSTTNPSSENETDEPIIPETFYENKEDKLSFVYPSGWTNKSSGETFKAVSDDYKDNGSGDVVQGGEFTYSIEPTDKTVAYFRSLKCNSGDVRCYVNKDVEIDGEPAVTFDEINTATGTIGRAVVVNGKMYSFKYTRYVISGGTYEQEFEDWLDSIKFSD